MDSSLPQLESSVADSTEASVVPIPKEDDSYYDRNDCRVHNNWVNKMQTQSRRQDVAYNNLNDGNMAPVDNKNKKTRRGAFDSCSSSSFEEVHQHKQQQSLPDSSSNEISESQESSVYVDRHSFPFDKNSIKFITELEITNTQSPALPSRSPQSPEAERTPSEANNPQGKANPSLSLPNINSTKPCSSAQKEAENSATSDSLRSSDDYWSLAEQANASIRGSLKRKEDNDRLWAQRRDCSSTTSTISSKPLKQTKNAFTPPVDLTKETISSAASFYAIKQTTTDVTTSTITTTTTHTSTNTRKCKLPLPKSPSRNSNEERLRKLMDEEKNRQSETESDLSELLRLVNELQMEQVEEEQGRQKETECALSELMQMVHSLQDDDQMEPLSHQLEAVVEEGSDEEDTSVNDKTETNLLTAAGQIISGLIQGERKPQSDSDVTGNVNQRRLNLRSSQKKPSASGRSSTCSDGAEKKTENGEISEESFPPRPNRRLAQTSSKLSSTTGESSNIYREKRLQGEDNGSIPTGLDWSQENTLAEHDVLSDVAKELGDFDKCGLLGFNYASDFILQLGLPPELKQLPESATDITEPPAEITIPAFHNTNTNTHTSTSKEGSAADEVTRMCGESSTGEEHQATDQLMMKKSASNDPIPSDEMDEKSIDNKYSSDWEGIKEIMEKYKIPSPPMESTDLKDANTPRDESLNLHKDERLLDVSVSASWEKTDGKCASVQEHSSQLKEALAEDNKCIANDDMKSGESSAHKKLLDYIKKRQQPSGDDKESVTDIRMQSSDVTGTNDAPGEQEESSIAPQNQPLGSLSTDGMELTKLIEVLNEEVSTASRCHKNHNDEWTKEPQENEKAGLDMQNEKQEKTPSVIVETVLSDSFSVSDDSKNDTKRNESKRWLFNAQSSENHKDKEEHQRPTTTKDSTQPSKHIVQDDSIRGESGHQGGYHRRLMLFNRRHDRVLKPRCSRHGLSHVWIPPQDFSATLKRFSRFSACLSTLCEQVLAVSDDLCSTTAKIKSMGKPKQTRGAQQTQKHLK